MTESTPPLGYAGGGPGHRGRGRRFGDVTTVDVMDHVIPATVSVLKVDRQTAAPLAGAVFDVAYDATHSGTFSVRT